MSVWGKNKIDANSINKGNEFTTNDVLTVAELNSIVNNSFYASETADTANEKSENAVKVANEAFDRAQSLGTKVFVGGEFKQEFNADTKANQVDLEELESKVAFKEDLKSGLPIGTIISSAVVLNDAGLHLLDGSSIATSGVYAEFCAWLTEKYNADNSSVPTCSESEWQNEVNTFGQCGKFVIGSDYVRLPKITKFIEGIANISDIGTSLGAGLPNITGGPIPHYAYEGEAVSQGALSTAQIANNAKMTSGINQAYYNLLLDASKSNSIYGNSDTVQPQATKYPYYIVVGSTTKTDIEVDLDNVASDLNLLNNQKADKDLTAKIDLSNVTYPTIAADGIVKSGSGDRVIESYISGDGNTWYRKWASGWKECGLTIDNVGTNWTFYTLPIEFSTTTYTKQVSTSSVGGYIAISTGASTTTQVYCRATTNGISCNVYCCGY